ncbi:hypothetical protein G9A89_008967 [Geosiphon pyriformis]|nr:hypothetical protein G9A89_008967 [Geosiphon pyriformis]
MAESPALTNHLPTLCGSHQEDEAATSATSRNSDLHASKAAWLSENKSTERKERTHLRTRAMACNSVSIEKTKPDIFTPNPESMSLKKTAAPAFIPIVPKPLRDSSIYTERRTVASMPNKLCAVICFGDEASKLAAIGTVLVFKGVSLHWAGLFLASCIHCKQFGHVTVNCSLGEYSGVRKKKVVSEQNRIRLAEIYKKKLALIACPVSFGGKTWAQVAGGSPSRVISSGLVGAGLYSGLVPSSMATDSLTISHLNDWLAILECSLELLSDHVSGILVRLESFDLVPMAIPSLSLFSAVSETLTSNVDSDMIVDTALVSSDTLPSIVHDAIVELSSSSSKVLTAKVGGLETKLIALEASVGSVLDKLNSLCSGSGLSASLSS